MNMPRAVGVRELRRIIRAFAKVVTKDMFVILIPYEVLVELSRQISLTRANCLIATTRAMAILNMGQPIVVDNCISIAVMH